MILLYKTSMGVFVFDPDVWASLRTEHRIVGSLVGCLPTLPRQNVFRGLPMILLPEQTILLVEKSLARLVTVPEITLKPSNEQREKFADEINSIKMERKRMYRQKKKELIESNLDTIISRRQTKLPVGTTLNKEDVLTEELKNIPELSNDSIPLIQRLTTPSYSETSIVDVSLDVIRSQTNPTKYRIFSDLWTRGFYLTDGLTFGGDFLAYLGDPVQYHASYIIKCIENLDTKFAVPELIALGRLSNTVRKKMVLAHLHSQNENIIKYVTIKWDYE